MKIISLAVLACAVISATPAPSSSQDYTASQRVDTTVALANGGTLRVSVFAGRVNIVGTSGSSVRVRGVVEKGQLRLRSRPTSVTLDTNPEGPRGGRADLDISVPFGTGIVLEGFSARVTISGVRGKANVETLSGSVEVTDAAGSVSVETLSGSVDLKSIKGDVRAESMSGRVIVTGVEGDVDGGSVSGRITITGARSKSVRAETVSGSVTYSGTFDPAGNYSLKSHSGTLRLGVPADVGATVSLQTFSGHVDSEFPVTLESGQQRRSNERRFEFKIGNGRSRIIAETFSGNVIIQRTITTDKE